ASGELGHLSWEEEWEKGRHSNPASSSTRRHEKRCGYEKAPEAAACMRLCQLGRGPGKDHRSEEQVWGVEGYALWLVDKAASGDKPSPPVEIPFPCGVYPQSTSYDLVPPANSTELTEDGITLPKSGVHGIHC
ncbi:unnamed protein product, partial [Prunus brigantina]